MWACSSRILVLCVAFYCLGLLVIVNFANTIISYFVDGAVLMLCAPSDRRQPFSLHTKMADFECFRVLSVFLWKKININSEKCIEYGK